MALTDTQVGALIGAGATVAGGLVTGGIGFLVDARRRRWEDQRRWDEARRRTYVDFFAASRKAFVRAARLAELYARVLERREALRGRQEGSSPAQPEDPELRRLAETIQRDQEQGDTWSVPLNEASAEIVLIASVPVRTAAEAVFQVTSDLMDLLDEKPGAGELHARLLVIAERYDHTKDAFQQAVARELRVERARPDREHRGWPGAKAELR